MEKNTKLKVIGKIFVFPLKIVSEDKKNNTTHIDVDKEGILDEYEVVNILTGPNGQKAYVTNVYNGTKLQLIPEFGVYDYHEY